MTSSAPFVRGGHLVIAEETIVALRAAGHDAELFQTPTNRFGRQFDAYRATALTDVSEGGDGVRIDRIVTLRYPAFALRHPSHVCWLTHTMREYYDLWESTIRPFRWRGRIKETLRRSWIHALDRRLLTRNVNRLYTISRTVTERLRDHIGVDSVPLYPPAPERAYRCDAYEPFVFGVSRLHELKRFDILIRAMREVRGLRAVIAGDGEARDQLQALARETGVDDRVTFAGPMDEAGKLDHLARCRAVFFAPRNEDYGFVTLEAMSSGKPVLTSVDSGGPTELVVNGVNGWILDGVPAFSRRLQALADDRASAEGLRHACIETATRHRWSDVAAQLAAPAA